MIKSYLSDRIDSNRYESPMSKKDIKDEISSKTKEIEKENEELKKKIKKLEDESLTRDEVKKMIRQTIINQYKYLWNKASFFIKNI